MLRKNKIKKEVFGDGDIKFSVEEALKNVRKNTILEDEQDRLSKSVNTFNRQLEQIKGEIAKVEKQREVSVKGLEVAEKEEAEAKAILESVLVEKKEAEEALSSKEAEVSSLNSSLIELRASYEAEKADLSSDINEIKNQKINAVKNLNDEIVRIKKEIGVFEITKQEIQAEIEKVKTEKANISNALAIIEEEKNRKEQIVESLGDVDAQKAEIEALKVVKNELSTGNEEIKEEILKGKNESSRIEKKNLEISKGGDERTKELIIQEEAAKKREMKLDIRNAEINRVAKTLQKHLDKLKIPIKVI